MEIKDILTFLIALYGAALATVTFFRQIRDKTPRVKVKLSTGPNGYDENVEHDTLFMAAINVGSMPVTLDSYEMLLPKEALSLAEEGRNFSLPHELLPGKNCQVLIGFGTLADLLKSRGYSGNIRLTGAYKDQTGAI